jgi:hypothetical protein
MTKKGKQMEVKEKQMETIGKTNGNQMETI